MSELRHSIQRHLEGDFLDRAFPALTKHGLRDEDVLIHSVGCSMWNTLGHELGYMAIVEGPAPIASGNDIRSDSIWFDRATNNPIVLIEFERYDGTERGKHKLIDKLVNLMEASLRWGNKPMLLILSAWSSGLVSAPSLSELENLFSRGTHNNIGGFIQRSAHCKLLLHRMVLDSRLDGCLQMKHMIFRWS